MKIENVKHLKLTLEIAARGDDCDVNCSFMRKGHVFGACCRLFGTLVEHRREDDLYHRHYLCKKFEEGDGR
jgi:hypothetical protein